MKKAKCKNCFWGVVDTDENEVEVLECYHSRGNLEKTKKLGHCDYYENRRVSEQNGGE